MKVHTRTRAVCSHNNVNTHLVAFECTDKDKAAIEAVYDASGLFSDEEPSSRTKALQTKLLFMYELLRLCAKATGGDFDVDNAARQ